MPTYEAICAKCGNVQEYVKPIAERNETPLCCEQPMERMLSAPMGFVDSPAAG